MTRFLAALVLCVAAFAAHAGEKDAMAEARRVFQRYVELGDAFDVQVAELYADTATIRNKRTYPNGQVRELSLPAPQYKQLLREAMPLAKARGDRNKYAEVKFAPEGKGVRITATRFSELKQYASPISLLVEPAGAGGWLIVEELSESRP